MLKDNKIKTAKTIALEYHEVWNEKDSNLVDSLMDENVVIHSLLGDFYGHHEVKEVIDAWLMAFPDLKVENISVISEKDMVAIHWKAHGTHRGEFKEIKPTGNSVSYSGVTLYRVHNDKVVEYWAYLDMQHLLSQIT